MRERTASKVFIGDSSKTKFNVEAARRRRNPRHDGLVIIDVHLLLEHAYGQKGFGAVNRIVDAEFAGEFTFHDAAGSHVHDGVVEAGGGTDIGKGRPFLAEVGGSELFVTGKFDQDVFQDKSHFAAGDRSAGLKR